MRRLATGGQRIVHSKSERSMNHITKTNPDTAHECVALPDFERLKFFYGQLLGVADFQIEQRFFLEKLRLHNRCFHGVGIVCGLEVDPVPMPEDCETVDDQQRAELKDAIAKLDAEIAELTGAVKKYAKDDSLKQRLRVARGPRRSISNGFWKSFQIVIPRTSQHPLKSMSVAAGQLTARGEKSLFASLNALICGNCCPPNRCTR